MVARDALGDRAFDGRVLGKVFLLRRFDEAAARPLVFEHLFDELVKGHLVGVFGVLGDVRLRLRRGDRRVGTVLVGNLLDQAHRRIDELLARRFHRALKQALRDEVALLASDFACLVDELHRHGAHVHQGKRGNLLRGARQDGVVALDAIHRRAVFGLAHFVHERRLALEEQQPEVAGASPSERCIELGLGSCGFFFGHLREVFRRELRGARRVLEIDDEQVARGRLLHAAKLAS